MRVPAAVALLAVSTVSTVSTVHAVGPSFNAAVQTGAFANGNIVEASGLVASRSNANVLWTHNDSGDSARVFATTPAGANLGTYSLSGATAVDWEDISVGPGPTAGVQYLYVADTGDNAGANDTPTRSNVAVYRVPEPSVSAAQSPVTTTLSGVSKLTLQYPDGARDAESMFVDPATRDIYVISKRDTPNRRVYRAAYPQSTSATNVMEFVTQFPFSANITAADISVDGDEIIVRATGSTSGRMYLRPVGGTIADAFATTPITIPLASEVQGEAIAFDAAGSGYYTTSEGAGAPIYYFARLPEPTTLALLTLAGPMLRRRR